MATADRPLSREELQDLLHFYATKEDVANAKTEIIRWLAYGLISATIIILTGVGVGVAIVAALLP